MNSRRPQPFPLFRLPEFVIGMALAVRLHDDPEAPPSPPVCMCVGECVGE